MSVFGTAAAAFYQLWTPNDSKLCMSILPKNKVKMNRKKIRYRRRFLWREDRVLCIAAQCVINAARQKRTFREQGVGSSNPPTPAFTVAQCFTLYNSGYNYPFLTPIAPEAGAQEGFFVLILKGFELFLADRKVSGYAQYARFLQRFGQGIRSVRRSAGDIERLI